ncbi:Protein of unknown function [Cetobacterium ceti]|uniref:DUF1097 domain-containing protein n=1 Tax=Cetobacterium ceti TaxID=180163 RepID=A0A1T4PC37_9FUSO|nr:DUF1097 domain-containing protein [Cetobacterium ceti]SJZ89145.1 Protein of unknown function [Cetobacterium ceti]
MKKLFFLSLTTGILCGLWFWIGIKTHIPVWMGFAGCTAFFAAGGINNGGVKKALFSTLSGVFWAVIVIALSKHFNQEYIFAIITGVVTFFMCIQGQCKLFAFIPGTFIGGFSTFASNGDWKMVSIGLILGIILGFSCDYTGEKSFLLFEKN